MSDLATTTGATCDIWDVSCHLSSFASWLLKVLLWIPEKLFELVTDGIAAIISAVPVPDAFTQAAQGMGSIPGGVMWFLDLCAAPEGLAMVLGALAVRFALKLIPTLSF